MDLNWLRHQAAADIFALTRDRRPAWLWRADDTTPLWRNGAAALFGARWYAGRLELFTEAQPISGQVARILRMGLMGQPARSRVQFLAGRRPIAANCLCTAFAADHGPAMVLIVGQAPIASAFFEAPQAQAVLAPRVSGTAYVLSDAEGAVLARGSYGAPMQAEAALDPARAQESAWGAMRFAAGEDGAQIAVALPPELQERDAARDAAPAPDPEPAFETPLEIDTHPTGTPPDAGSGDEAPEASAAPANEFDAKASAESDTQAGDAPEAAQEVSGQDTQDQDRPAPFEESRGLRGLVARLTDHSALFGPLEDGNDDYDATLVHAHAAHALAQNAPVALLEGVESEDETDRVRDAANAFDDAELERAVDIAEPADFAPGEDAQAMPPATLWQVTGRGLTRAEPPPQAPDPETHAESEEAPEDAREDAASQEPNAAEPASPVETPSAVLASDAIDTASRYNFEELSRILNDRIGREAATATASESEEAANPAPVVALSDETLVLNRLPLGILLFRDLDILFANRAFVELTGHDSAAALRAAGLDAVLARATAAGTGPVTELLRHDGSHVSVHARLQSVTWQGRAAMMLSARVPETRAEDEQAVKSFARLFAQQSRAHYLETDRSGRITELSEPLAGDIAVGGTLSALVAQAGRPALRAFLEAPAQTADTERPVLTLETRTGGTLSLYTQGRAGRISGYFGMVSPAPSPAVAPEMPEKGLPSPALGRISRDLRRPLSTILGFSELMNAESFGPLGHQRYREYARDIENAGRAIRDLADELDDFARLSAGAQALSLSDVDLGALLDSCVSRVRAQAGSNRILLRSSISARLPHVRVDAPTVRQAILNMLASAIAHSGEGGRVILSAQQERNGDVAIHIRDTAQTGSDIADRFTVFRDGSANNGEARFPLASSIGLTLTRSLAAVNALALSIDPASETGTLMTLIVPSDRVVRAAE